MRRVILESPYRHEDAHMIQVNKEYAVACMLDALKRGEAPLLSHLLYTQGLDDHIPEDRALGIKAGLAWLPGAEAVVFYLDLGRSTGMVGAAARLHALGKDSHLKFEMRTLGMAANPYRLRRHLDAYRGPEDFPAT